MRSGEERILVMMSGGGSGGKGGEIRIAGKQIYFIYTDHGGDVVDGEEDAKKATAATTTAIATATARQTPISVTSTALQLLATKY